MKLESMRPRSSTLRILSYASLAVTVAGCSLFDNSSPPALTDTIVFVSSRHQTEQLYVMRSDGSHLRQLTNVVGYKDTPSFSPDGRRVAFAMSDTAAGSSPLIYVVNTDGSGLAQLTSGIDYDIFPSWSPDGTQIVFASTRARNGFLGIFTMNADGSGLHAIDADMAVNSIPSWSPATNAILFTSLEFTSPSGLYTMSPTGDARRLLVDGQQSQWSPTGTQFTFECGPFAMCIARDPEASVVDTLPITDHGFGYSSPPKWSPDESRIAYVGSGPGFNPREIWTASSANGSGQVQLTPDTEGENWAPDWSRH